MRFSDLPEPRLGKMWAYLFWPGGRRELRQYAPDVLMDKDEAVEALRQGKCAYVRPADGPYVLEKWKSAKIGDATRKG